jgi:HEAT repeat protein
MRKLAGMIVATLVLSACNDPNSPETWIRKLKDIRERKEARLMLVKLSNPAAVPALMNLYKEDKDPETLKALAHFHDKRSVPLHIEVLADFSEETVDSCSVSAAELGILGDPAAVEPLIKALQNSKIPIRSRANIVKQEAMLSLAKLKDPRGLDAIIKVLGRSADEQDFFLNKVAAIQLGKIGDPKAIPGLIRGMFMTGRGADIFQECRLSLVQIGDAVVDPLVDLLQEKNADVNEMAKKLEFDKYTPGVVPAKAAYVLGDLRAKKALPALLARLKEKVRNPKNNMRISILVTLGQYGDPSTIPDVVEVLRDKTSSDMERGKAAEALNFIGDRKSLPTLFDCVKDTKTTPPNVRVACAFSFASLGTDADYAKFEPLAKKEGYAEFEAALLRLKTAKTCKQDATCYGKIFAPGTVSDEVQHGMLKAAYELGRFDRAQALPVVLESLGKADQLEVEQALLFSLSRLADKSCKKCKERLEEVLEKKSKVPTQAAKALVNELRIALAAYSR